MLLQKGLACIRRYLQQIDARQPAMVPPERRPAERRQHGLPSPHTHRDAPPPSPSLAQPPRTTADPPPGRYRPGSPPRTQKAQPWGL